MTSLISIVLFSLITQATTLEPGVFERKKGKGNDYVLELKENGEFNYRYISLVNAKCSGKWEWKDNILFLKCDPSAPWAMISSGYISERNFTMKVLSKNKLKFKNYRLVRQKKA
jgi:hypothetical protein